MQTKIIKFWFPHLRFLSSSQMVSYSVTFCSLFCSLSFLLLTLIFVYQYQPLKLDWTVAYCRNCCVFRRCSSRVSVQKHRITTGVTGFAFYFNVCYYFIASQSFRLVLMLLLMVLFLPLCVGVWFLLYFLCNVFSFYYDEITLSCGALWFNCVFSLSILRHCLLCYAILWCLSNYFRCLNK